MAFRHHCDLGKSLLLALLSLGGSAARAADLNSDAVDALKVLGRFNQADALEPASAHGSMGLTVGAGAASYALATDNPILQSLLGQAGQTTGSYAVPRAWIVKGLPIPVDLGLSAGAPAGSAFAQVSGHLQWTVYEAFAMPALALRANYARLYGQDGATIATTGAEAVASYSFLRYITVYGGLGLNQNHGELTLAPSSTVTYALQGQAAAATTVTQSWTEPTHHLGIKVLVIPPFVAATAEAEMTPSTRDYAAKLSVWL